MKLCWKLCSSRRGDTLILSGTTGEFFSQTAEERIKLFEVMVKTLKRKIPLIAGIGTFLAETIKLAKAENWVLSCNGSLTILH